jgi:hypothetical protein
VLFASREKQRRAVIFKRHIKPFIFLGALLFQPTPVDSVLVKLGPARTSKCGVTTQHSFDSRVAFYFARSNEKREALYLSRGLQQAPRSERGTSANSKQTPRTQTTDCATDATYQYFERIQKREYLKNPIARKYLDSRTVDALLDQKGNELNQRPNTGNAKKPYSTEELNSIKQQLKMIKLPTCYEDSMIHFLISNYVSEIERARQALKLQLVLPPKYGTLPIADINAATYPATATTDSIIGFNAQLFMFDYEMAKVVLPLFDIGLNAENSLMADISRKSVERVLKENRNIANNFLSALLEFMLLIPQQDRPVDQVYDVPVMALATGMELFAVGHEYGHLIKKHVSSQTTLQFAEGNKDVAVENYAVPVLLRSWKQEFEADDIGLTLEIQVLRNSPVFYDPLRWLYMLYGVEFYFKCMEVVDRAKYVRDNGRLPQALTPEEVAYLRSVENGPPNDKDAVRFAKLLTENHPPAWLRLERMQREIDKYVKGQSIPENVRAYSQLGAAIIEDVDLLWDSTASNLPALIQEVRQN